MQQNGTVGRINSDATSMLVASICRGKLWATPEETEEWKKTESGKRICAKIEEDRRKENERKRAKGNQDPDRSGRLCI